MLAIQLDTPQTLAKNRGTAHVFTSMLTGTQIRMAIGGLNWSTTELARRTGLSWDSVRRACMPDGVPPIRATALNMIEQTLREAGVSFLEADATRGEGIRLRRTEQ